LAFRIQARRPITRGYQFPTQLYGIFSIHHLHTESVMKLFGCPEVVLHRRLQEPQNIFGL
jgi:hypothetical protein